MTNHERKEGNMKLDMTKANRWKLPKASYTNFRKEFPGMGNTCFQRWLSFGRHWGGKIWYIGIKHHQVSLDFRRCAASDMVWPDATKRDRRAVKEASKYL